MEKLELAILDYFADLVPASDIAEEFGLHWGKTLKILSEAKEEWRAVGVDEEGATPERERDLIIIRAIEALK